MLRVTIGGLIGTVLGVVGWRILRRPALPPASDRHEPSQAPWNIDPGMVITPPEVDTRMVITPPEVDPKMVVTPRPRREGDVPPEVRM
jgi:hypothetical protein